MSPITQIVSIATSAILVMVFMFVGFITACDILYLYVPFMRIPLAGQNAQAQSMSSGMGYGGGGMGMGGFSGGFNSIQSAPQQGNSERRVKFVSTEVLQAMAEAGDATSQGGIDGGMPNAMFNQQQQQRPTHKSAGRIYLQKRIVALVFLGIMAVLLMSSFFTDLGINVGMVILKLVAMLPFVN